MTIGKPPVHYSSGIVCCVPFDLSVYQARDLKFVYTVAYRSTLNFNVVHDHDGMMMHMGYSSGFCDKSMEIVVSF